MSVNPANVDRARVTTMKKIPTLYARNPDDRKHVLPTVTPGCEWVLAGEGTATRKYDGTCVLIRDSQMFKRREVRDTKASPAGFEEVEHDTFTGKRVGWVPVDDIAPDDQWHREAVLAGSSDVCWVADGTYELIGPKI